MSRVKLKTTYHTKIPIFSFKWKKPKTKKQTKSANENIETTWMLELSGKYLKAAIIKMIQ